MKSYSMKRRVCIIFMAIALAVIFTACSQSGGTSGQEESADAAQATDESAEDAGTAAADQDTEAINLVVWEPSLTLSRTDLPKEETTWYKFIKQFEEDHPGVTVEVVTQASDQWYALWAAANAAKNGPDVVMPWPDVEFVRNSDSLLDITDKIPQEMLENYSCWDEVRRDYAQDGAILGVPVGVYQYGFYYNKEMFAEVGIDESNLPKTFDEFIAVLEKIKAKGNTPMMLGDKEGWGTDWALRNIAASLIGPDWAKYDEPGATVVGSEWQEASAIWAEVGKKELLNPDYSAVANADAATKFSNGEAATLLDGTWDAALLLEAMGDNLGVMRVPYADPSSEYKDYIHSGSAYAMSVTSYSKHPDLATEFILHMSSPEFQIAFANEAGAPPNITNLPEGSIDNEAINLFMTANAGTKAAPIMYSYKTPNANADFLKVAPLLLNGKISPEELMKRYQEAREKEMEA